MRHNILRRFGSVLPALVLVSVPNHSVRAQEQGIVLGRLIVNSGTDSLVASVSALSRLTMQGGVVVVDLQSQSIHHFTPQARLLWSSGRRGAGPGEFQSISAVGVDSTRIVVLDRALRRTMVLNAVTGSAAQTTPFPTPPVALSAIGPSPIFIAETVDCRLWMVPERREGRPSTFHAVVAEGPKVAPRVLWSSSTLGGPIVIKFKGQDRAFFPPYPPGPPASYEVARGEVLVVEEPRTGRQKSRFGLSRFDACGRRTTEQRNFELPAEPLPPRDRERYVKAWLAAGERIGIPASQMRAAVEKGVRLPPAYPPLLAASLTTDGQVVGRRTGEAYEPVSSVPREWIVLQPHGSEVRRFTTRGTMTVLDIVGKTVLLRDLPEGPGGAEILRLGVLSN